MVWGLLEGVLLDHRLAPLFAVIGLHASGTQPEGQGKVVVPAQLLAVGRLGTYDTVLVELD
jgi:hypothetical protein